MVAWSGVSDANLVHASQLVPSMFMAQEPHTLAAGAPEGERRINLALDPDQNVQNHHATIVEIDLK